MAPNFPAIQQPPLQNPPLFTPFSSLTHVNIQIYNHTHTNTKTLSIKITAMVVALGPGKFYGSSLPRPRFFTDVTLNPSRVDPPLPVLDPLMSWAHEAHWSMGGLSFKRTRLQGRIEGNISRLRAHLDHHSSPPPPKDNNNNSRRVTESTSPPPPPVAIKRRRVVGLVDEEEEDDDDVAIGVKKRGPVRKLGDDFERVARESGMSSVVVETRTRAKTSDEGKSKKRRELVKGGRRIGASVAAAAVGIRSSPRLAKSGGGSR